ncbi:hypothetical protein J5J10_15245 [Ciceribacter sp. L1K23]|uniref:hypothetical protein n=1 Tax=Ciceribacter sp. L1K23 TaxID=2820276 RepID=UPI001B81C0D1|nr:hypothetical protein [Ciceribacter sp. L1K23]MBR0557042.1 hypothetical protein [Ciceribacter sp. L1K23]
MKLPRFTKSFFSRKSNPRPTELSLPAWFVGSSGAPIKPSGVPFFLYQSWIPEHTDKLVKAVGHTAQYDLVDLQMMRNQNNKGERLSILRFAERNPDIYRRMALHKLAPYRSKTAGLIVTLDWIPAMRHLVLAARQLGIPTLLLPHEAVFAKEDMYYVHISTGVNIPACDIMFAWGDLQEEIFVSRGYPRERIIKTGAPKFDYITSLDSKRDKSCLVALGLNPAEPVITFAAQPLDSQYDKQMARRAQTEAITDLLSCAKDLDFQVVVRTPPSRDEILTPELKALIESDTRFAIDYAGLYLLSPEETIAASDVLMSINSTMLLEAALAGKVAISSKYVEFDQIWDNANLQVVKTRSEMFATLKDALISPTPLTACYNLTWAAKAFSIGQFDGLSATRIASILDDIANGRRKIAPLPG